MDPPVQPNKITKVSEQVFNSVQTPLIVNNQIFLMVQQDIRKIEETRHISYRRLTQEEQGFGGGSPFVIDPFRPCLASYSRAFPPNSNPCPAMDWTTKPPLYNTSESTSTSELHVVNNSCSQAEKGIKLSVGNESSCKSYLVKEFSGNNTDSIFLRDDDGEEMSALEQLKLRKVLESSLV